MVMYLPLWVKMSPVYAERVAIIFDTIHARRSTPPDTSLAQISRWLSTEQERKKSQRHAATSKFRVQTKKIIQMKYSKGPDIGL